jgi:hypothetical protein
MNWVGLSRATRAMAVIITGPVRSRAGLSSVVRLVDRQQTSSALQQARSGRLCLWQVVNQAKATWQP